MVATDWGEVLGAIQEHWLGSFLLNILGYALIILPAAVLIRKWKTSPEVQSGERHPLLFVYTVQKYHEY